MGLFDVIRDTASRLLDDNSKEDTLYSRRLNRDELLRLRFHLPEPETLMSQVSAAISILPLGPNAPRDARVEDIWDGTAYLSESFIMFECASDPRLLTFAIPLATVRRVDRLPSRSSMFALKVTLYQDVQLVLQFDGVYSDCVEFSKLFGANLKSQVPLAKQLRRISTSFYSEYLIESAARRKQGQPKDQITKEVAVPAGGLGREFGYPGDARANRERSKMRLWVEYFGGHGRNIGLLRQPEFYKLVRVGLPSALRGEMWELCCGSVQQRMKARQLYLSLVEDNAGKVSQATDEIDKDLNRSLPEYAAYQSPTGIDRLRRVLVAYSWMCPEVGYCQAMNIVTAALLIYQTEEQAFWTLHVLVTRILPGYYSRTMYGMLLDQKVLECLVEKTMPILWQHLVATDVPLSVVSLPWFLSLFANSMPLLYAFRVIDILMLEGSRVLFQIALAILRVNGEALLNAQDNTAVIEILKGFFDTLGQPSHLRSSGESRRPITKFQELLSTAFKEFSVVSDDWIRELRAKYEAPVLADIESYAKRTQIRNIPKPHNLGIAEMGVIYDTFYAALQATRPGLGGNEGELTFYQFVTFMSQLVDWAAPVIVAREEAEASPFLRKLFASWNTRNQESLNLSDCTGGFDQLVNPDMMELVNYYFSLFATRNESGEEGLDYQGILDAADGLLLMSRPFSEKHAGAVVLDGLSTRELATKGPLEDEARLLVLDRLQQQQSARYLGAVSSFIQRAFEVAGLKDVQPELGKASVSQPDNLIDMPESADSGDGKKDTANSSSSSAPRQGAGKLLSLPHFRMVVLADETLELFFSQTLRSTIHLTEEGTGALSGIFEAGGLRSMMNNVMREGLQLADGLWGRTKDKVSLIDEKQDELGDDDLSVRASDRALLDI